MTVEVLVDGVGVSKAISVNTTMMTDGSASFDITLPYAPSLGSAVSIMYDSRTITTGTITSVSSGTGGTWLVSGTSSSWPYVSYPKPSHPLPPNERRIISRVIIESIVRGMA